MVLSKFGLKGVVQAVGYVEQKDVVPVIGQSTPTVRYYLPTLHKRLGVPDIQRCFRSLRITSIDTFLSKVCDCAICRGVIGKGLESFREFGDTQYSRPESKRAAQTPAAAKRCKFHFLLSRNREQASLREDSLQSILARWQEASATWVLQPSLRDEAAHLARWNEALLPVT